MIGSDHEELLSLEAMAERLQTIHYHQGLLSFGIPEHWTSSVDARTNKVIFRQESEDAGILCLHYARIISCDSARTNVASMAEQFAEAGQVAREKDGSYMATRTEQVVEDDRYCLVLHWFNLNPLDESRVRVAHLSFTASLERLQQPESLGELELVNRCMSSLCWSTPDILCAGLRTLLVPLEAVDESIVHYAVSEQIAMVVAFETGPDSFELGTYSDFEAWSVPADEVWRRAFENMDQILAQAQLVIEKPEGYVPMAFFETVSPVQAALVTAPSLRRTVEPEIGWPVQAILPCSDFLHILPGNWLPSPEQAYALAELVIDEYMNSAQPLSTELFLIDDQGIQAIGSFQCGGFTGFDHAASRGAAEELARVACANPVDAQQFYNRGLIYSTMLDHVRAIDDFTRAIELNPDVADYYRSRAVEYELLGDDERAREDIDQAGHLS